MRIIVCPHDMGMGGSQLNAIDLAAGIRERGHDVMLYCAPGPLVDHAARRGLEWTPSASALRPSRAWGRGLVRLARTWRADLVHTYEWAPSLGAAFGAHVALNLPQVMTVLSMEVPRFLPRHLDLVVGTGRLLAETAQWPHRHLIEPPIDTEADAPGDRDGARRQWGVRDEDVLVTVVGRMTGDLDKDAGVLAAIRAVDELTGTHPVVLLAAGDGPSLAEVRRAAEQVNARHGRRVVITPGNLADPAPAYNAADVVVGMGSSILRGMSFGAPGVVLGERGYARPVTAATLPEFRREGFFGSGTGRFDETLRDELRHLAERPDVRADRGRWSRTMVEENFGLRTAVCRLDAIYRGAAARGPFGARTAFSLAHSAAGYASFRINRSRAARRDAVAA